MSVERKRFECSAIPKGWHREEVVRKSGLSAGKVDVYYYSPDGQKFRSKPQLARCLGQPVESVAFDFHPSKKDTDSSGNDNNGKDRMSKKKIGKENRRQNSPVDITGYISRGVRSDASLVPPIRQTASIFKQPVTVIKQMEGKVKAEFKHGGQEKPKQLFWEKRLEGMRPCDTEGLELDAMELPKGLKAVGPHVTEETILQSVATALHVSNQPITGQTGSKTALEKNPGVFINPDQPLVQAVAVGEEDIKRQEERVSLARKKLEEALRNLKQ